MFVHVVVYDRAKLRDVRTTCVASARAQVVYVVYTTGVCRTHARHARPA